MATQEQVQAAVNFLSEYRGDFGFLQDMQARVRTGRTLSENMVTAILRCAAREAKPAAKATTAPVSSGLDLRAHLPSGTVHVAVGKPLQFFKIDNVADGKWAGWVFVKRQAGDNYDRIGRQRPGGMYEGAFTDLLGMVTRHLQEAMQQYGTELGQCAVCNRSLTDETSRARGIGPDCWERLAAEGKVQAATARDNAAERAADRAAKDAFAEREAEQERISFILRGM